MGAGQRIEDKKLLSDKIHEKLDEYLKKSGLRQTKHRKLLLDIVIEMGPHFDVEKLASLAKKKDPELGIATVYRNLGVFKAAGFLAENQFGNGKSIYEICDPDGEHHDHLICMQCGEIIEFMDPELEKIQDTLARRLGFTLSHHKMELYGNCVRFPDCKNEKSKQL